MSAYDEAVTTLYQAPLADFVTERKRLATELKATGDKDASARVAKLVRPPVSAWAVNQLWWRQREAFEALLAVAARVRVGDREASQAHRQILTRLKETAARLLQEAGNAATDTTLRRVTTTLSAVAAIGGFDPDAAGALSADRDPPGFEALGFSAAPATPAAATATPGAAESDKNAETARAEEAERRRADEAERRRAEEAERRRAEEAERRRRLAERERLSARLGDAEQLRASQQSSLQRLRAELEAAERGLKESQAQIEQLEAELTSL